MWALDHDKLLIMGKTKDMLSILRSTILGPFVYWKWPIEDPDKGLIWLRWANSCLAEWDITMRDDGGDELNRGKTIFLMPHFSYGDWVFSIIATDGRASFLSRVMPWLSIVGGAWHNLSTGFMWVFKRGVKRSGKEWRQWLDHKFRTSPFTDSLAIYPEGHRNRSGDPLPLKKGILYYAYTRKVPVQTVMLRGITDSVDFSDLSLQRGSVVGYRRYGVVRPEDYGDEASFIEAAEKNFIDAYDEYITQEKNF